MHRLERLVERLIATRLVDVGQARPVESATVHGNNDVNADKAKGRLSVEESRTQPGQVWNACVFPVLVFLTQAGSFLVVFNRF